MNLFINKKSEKTIEAIILLFGIVMYFFVQKESFSSEESSCISWFFICIEKKNLTRYTAQKSK